MGSRAKFEEWTRKPVDKISDVTAWFTNDTHEIAWQAWKAGRESMREEACNAADLSWVKDPRVTASDAIKQIEP